jgi:hypothetical protein
MADLRSLSTVLETDLKQSKGVVGWGTFAIKLSSVSVPITNVCQRRLVFQMRTIQQKRFQHSP